MGDSTSEQYFSSLPVIRHSCATPLTNIIVNLELSLNSNVLEKSKSNYQFYLQQALISARYLKKMISTDCSSRNLKFKLKTAVREVTAITKRPLAKCQLISFVKVGGRLELTGSKLYFQECLICLLNNALESYPPNAANKLIVLTVKRLMKEGLVEIRVTDGGSGFKQFSEPQQKIQLRDSGSKQTGLPFVKKVVENHFQGQVKIDTYPNKGSTVICTLPINI